MADGTAVRPPRISGFSYVRPLGAGGFAQVYQYEQDMPRRVVAVKVLGEDFASSSARSGFEAEADAMARLSSHPSIVSIFSASVSSDGRPYIAMEYCPESFRDRSRGSAAPLDQVLDAGVRLAGALETAHQSGVLHRDIKPSNVLLATTGRPVLADFGIVSLRGQMRGEGTSQAMSIPWAAPEVVSGETSGTVASEVWSLGATLYTFAAGKAPFASPDGSRQSQEALKSRIQRARYTPVPGVRGYEAFDAVIARALAKQPERRFASMREFGEALQQLQAHYGLVPTQLDVIESAWVTPPAATSGVRGPSISAVQGSGRAERRAELARQREATAPPARRPRPAALRPALIGAGSAAAVLALAAVVLALMGRL
ncbi:serine/threonine-protein kinase [Leucobacter massiliensis]|uniref:non-specific serine/threonine protein kinase n=1 Tax=Leucobacter massiliensis TaxID=1686285 RepID=A0A2S9QL91_9MICO|nr:serine/threonine-protein kinase [Leucobacter massiliensis]PRI10358.1 serine/threonine protein kinase [Leucobacter massiliensis]